jgi:hypothetical protein
MREPRNHAATDDPADAAVGVPLRGRAAVAASILVAFLLAAYLAASPGGVRTAPGEYLLAAAILAVAFWFPAMRIASVGDLLRQWPAMTFWLGAWVVVWDVASSGIFNRRALFQDWWIVYPAGLLCLVALLLIQGAVMGRARRRGDGDATGAAP